MVVVIVFCAVLVAGIAGGVIAATGRTKAIKSSPSGSVRIETVKAHSANTTISEYARAGWKLDAQSSAKSLGRQAQVTLTFVKK